MEACGCQVAFWAASGRPVAARTPSGVRRNGFWKPCFAKMAPQGCISVACGNMPAPGLGEVRTGAAISRCCCCIDAPRSVMSEGMFFRYVMGS